MPKGIKSPQSPIQKRVQEICQALLIVPAPPLIASIEENLVGQINEEMVLKAHKTYLQTRKGPQKSETNPPAPKKTSVPPEMGNNPFPEEE